MKLALATAVSTVALAALAGPAFAGEPGVEIRSAVARVAVVVEDRADIAVEIEQGTSRLPRVTVTRSGRDVRIDGGLRRRGGMFNGGNSGIRECHTGRDTGRPGEGAWVQVRDVGRVNLSDAPLILVRVPRDVDVSAGGHFRLGRHRRAFGRAGARRLRPLGCGQCSRTGRTGDCRFG